MVTWNDAVFIFYMSVTMVTWNDMVRRTVELSNISLVFQHVSAN